MTTETMFPIRPRRRASRGILFVSAVIAGALAVGMFIAAVVLLASGL